MMQWRTLFKKEMIGSFRDRKWLWIPLVFILLTIMDPITNYYLPQILEAVGGLPDGAMIEFPEITGVEAMMMSLSQLSSLGVLVIALSSSGMISSEIKNGVAELILVKPVSFTSYITSKWAALLAIVWSAYLISMFAAWYYIGILYEFIPVADFLLLFVFYGLWLTLVASLSIFYNAICKTPGLVAFLTIGTLIFMSLVTMVFNKYVSWSPNNLLEHIQTMLLTGDIPTELYGASTVTIALSLILIALAINIFRKREHAV